MDVKAFLIVAFMAGVIPCSAAAAPQDNTPPATSMIPSDPSDIYVQGKYDNTGTYIPPHYAPKPKPVFHGYFDKNAEYKHGYFDAPKPKVKPVDPNAPPN